MNPNNYCSLEMSRKLVEAEVVLETDAHWCRTALSEWEVRDYTESKRWYIEIKIPAPNASELWRELPVGTYLYKGEDQSEAFLKKTRVGVHIDTNLCDALAELLIEIGMEAKDEVKKKIR